MTFKTLMAFINASLANEDEAIYDDIANEIKVRSHFD